MPVRFYFKKLVRDGVLTNSQNDSKVLNIDYRIMQREEFIRALIAKVHEESAEIPVIDQVNDEVVAEIADLQSVVDELMRQYGVSPEAIRQAKKVKYEKKGGFDRRVYIDSVLLADDSKWIEVFRKQPDKYPESIAEGQL